MNGPLLRHVEDTGQSRTGADGSHAEYDLRHVTLSPNPPHPRIALSELAEDVVGNVSYWLGDTIR